MNQAANLSVMERRRIINFPNHYFMHVNDIGKEDMSEWNTESQSFFKRVRNKTSVPQCLCVPFIVGTPFFYTPAFSFR